MAYAECIEVDHDGPVTTVIINRPQARNACSVDMILALHSAFAAFERDPDARVAVLTGVEEASLRCRCRSPRDRRRHGHRVLLGLGADAGRHPSLPAVKPVIAAINGPALAAGLALAVWCDLRVAADNATFGVVLPSVRRPDAERCHRPAAAPDRSEPRARPDAHRPHHRRWRSPPHGARQPGRTGRYARREAASLALDLASMPAAAMLADRSSLLRQWSLPEEDAIRYEVEVGKAVFGRDFQAGAARSGFGEGRHGAELSRLSSRLSRRRVSFGRSIPSRHFPAAQVNECANRWHGSP